MLNQIKQFTLHQWLLIFGALACLFFYSYRLEFPPTKYFDEVYFPTTAKEYLSLKQTTTDTAHPPLGKLLMSLSILAFGDVSWAWRLVSLISGLFLILTVYALAKKILKQLWMALFVTFLFATEGMHLTQSRIAMLNAPMMLCMFLSLLAVIPYFIDKNAPRTRAFAMSGAFLGIAVAIRWVGVAIVGVIGIFLIKRFLEEENKLLFLRDFVLFYVALPVFVYFASHIIIPLGQGYPWKNIWTYQFHMARYHATLKEGHGYGSAWWGWPLLVRPIWYFFERKEGFVYGILCIGNPAIYWMIPFAMGYVLFKWLEKPSTLYALILVGFFQAWLPWAVIGRVKFFHYFYPATPFIAMAIALWMQRIWQIGPRGRIIVTAYVMLVAILFLYWYPVYTGLPMTEAFFQNHLWFKSWI